MTVTVTMPGQIRGGKNHIIITRSGHRFPEKAWAKWRDAMVAIVRSQLPRGHKAIDVPCAVILNYTPEDNRRRDVPAILDAIWHVLEKAGVVSDDRWLGAAGLDYEAHPPDKAGACAVVSIVTG